MKKVRTKEGLWDLLNQFEELECNLLELRRVIDVSAGWMTPGDGLKIERLGNGNYFVSIWK